MMDVTTFMDFNGKSFWPQHTPELNNSTIGFRSGCALEHDNDYLETISTRLPTLHDTFIGKAYHLKRIMDAK
jgi:hypothetical protein